MSRVWSIALAALLCALFLPALLRPLQDPDLWWLLWAGEQPGVAVNGMSWTAPAHPWTLHEPLVAWLYAAVGIEQLARLRNLMLAAMAAVGLGLIGRRSAWAALLSVLWWLPLCTIASSERAMAWGVLAAGATVLALERRRPALAAVAVLIWSALHGSFPLGVALLILFAPRWGLAVLALTALVRFDAWLLAVDYLRGDGVYGLVHAHVEEWRPLIPRDVASSARALAVVAGAAAAWSRGGRQRFLILLAPLALLHLRMAAVAGIIWLPSVAAWLDGKVPVRPLGAGKWIALPVLLAIGLVRPPSLSEPAVPVVGERVYNDLMLGGWLGYRGVPVFWDSRNDCYPVSVFADGLKITHRTQGWQEVLEVWEIDTVVTQDPVLADALGWSRVEGGGLITLRRD